MFASSKTAAVVNAIPNYIEEVFSCFLYTGNNSTQTITNAIDLSTKGGLVWTKSRNALSSMVNIDTTLGLLKYITTTGPFGAQNNSSSQNITSVSTTGYDLGTDESGGATLNASATTYVSWTFRKQPKFFDIVTYTGNSANRTVSHNLGSVPGCIIIKQTTGAFENWIVYHRSWGATGGAFFNTNDQFYDDSTYFNNTSPTSTDFTLSTAGQVNTNSETYVAYLFAHDAGGFGLTGADNVISCGTYTGNGSATGPVVTLGYEPQWLMIKKSSSTGNWQMLDNMRGMSVGSADAALRANLTNTESSVEYVSPTSTGFQITSTNTEVNTNTATYIYIAIRRGPMKVPTDATKVFGLSARTGTGANDTVTGGQTDDAVLIKNRGSAVASLFASRLTGTRYLVTSTSAAEVAAGTTILQANPWDVMDGVKVGTTSTITNASANTYINYLFKRAPSFFDEVCYTGTGANRTVSHNLGVAPELMIIKKRSSGNLWNWSVYISSGGNTNYLSLNTTDRLFNDPNFWNNTTPTSSLFTLGIGSEINESAGTFVAYLFATCAGVSKVGSYTGNGTSQTINCGLTAGARFVLIKRTDATGDWYVYDTARGMTLLTDPYWRTNSTAAEVATLGSVTTVATGFAVDSTILAAINVSGGTYIFLAIA